MSSSETPFRVSVATDVETFVVGRSYELVTRGVGSFSGELAPGIYKFNFRRGTASSEQFVEILPDRTEPVVVVPAQELELDTAVPLAKSKRSGARQVSAAREMSRQTQVHAGYGSSLYVFIRNDAEAPPRDPAAGFTLHALDGSLMADLGQVAVRDDVSHPTYAACNIAVTPGGYRLRYDDGEDELEQIVIARAAWQTQVFLLHSAFPTEGLPAPATHPLANASVLMCHAEFDPDNEMIELADAARIALSLGRIRMPRDLMSKLLTDKFESPMLGIYAAHAIVASGNRDELLERVLSALEMTIGNHPDVAALRLGSREGVTIEAPPMLRSSWNAIVAATLDGKASLAPGSLASRLPTSFVSDTPWLIWSVRELVPAAATATRDVSADLAEIQLLIGAPPGKATLKFPELTGWEEAIYSYLQRRASYQSEETTTLRGPMRGATTLESLEAFDAVTPTAAPEVRLDDRAIARAFGTTVNHVQATVAGLSAKLNLSPAIAFLASELIRVCLDPPELEQPTQIAERMALMNGATWGPGYMLRIRFLGGAKPVRAKVRHYAEQWREHANIHMAFVEDGDADIRIAFTPGGASKSLLGRLAMQQAPDQTQPTMWYGGFDEHTSDEEYRRVVLHEFGHALGCIHEHQNPHSGIHWDKEKVYQYYAGLGYTKERVDRQVLNTYDKNLITSTGAADPRSIMLYPVPKELTTNGFEAGWNTELSERDKQFIRTLYPW